MQTILTHFLYASRIGSLLYVSITLLLKLGQRCAMLRIWSSLLTKCTFIAAELCHKSCCCICNQAEKLVHLALPLYRTNNQSKTAYCIRMQCTKPTTFLTIISSSVQGFRFSFLLSLSRCLKNQSTKTRFKAVHSKSVSQYCKSSCRLSNK